MTYDYECTECAHVWEEQRCVDDRDNESFCPECGGDGKRVMSANVGFVLKGSGWYRDGYSTYVGDMMPKQMHGKKYK